jgi:hypothetical protein
MRQLREPRCTVAAACVAAAVTRGAPARGLEPASEWRRSILLQGRRADRMARLACAAPHEAPAGACFHKSVMPDPVSTSHSHLSAPMTVYPGAKRPGVIGPRPVLPCPLDAHRPWRLSGRMQSFRVARSSLSSKWPDFFLSFLWRASAAQCDTRPQHLLTIDGSYSVISLPRLPC